METKIFAFEKPGVGERALGLPWKPIAEPRRSRRHSHSVSGSVVVKLTAPCLGDTWVPTDTAGHISTLHEGNSASRQDWKEEKGISCLDVTGL